MEVNSRRRDLRPHRTLEFSYGAFTPQETKGRYTPPWNPSTRFPPASWGVYSTEIRMVKPNPQPGVSPEMGSWPKFRKSWRRWRKAVIWLTTPICRAGRPQPIFTYLLKSSGIRRLREIRKTQTEKIKNKIRGIFDQNVFRGNLPRKVRVPPDRR